VRGNYATLNPLSGTGTLANGNLDVSASFIRTSTIAASTGKWYFEVLVGSIPENTYFGGYLLPGSFGQGLVTYRVNTGEYDGGGGYSGTGSFSASATTGDLLGLAYNLDAGTFQVFKNGSSIGTISGIPFNGKTIHFGGHTNGSATIASVFNFGQRPFAYTAPSGFKALCTANLPAPLVTNPSTVMDVLTWTGDNTNNRAITGLGFSTSPDLVWIKNRSSGSFYHNKWDAVRGVGNSLSSNDTAAELLLASNVAGYVSAFNSDGFTLTQGSGSINNVNGSGYSYVAWCWDAGSSTVTNTQGSISSQVRANASAGFSIVTYTGTGTNGATVGHGLGVVPGMVIVKSRSNAYEWPVYHSSLTSGNNLFLHLTNAQNSVSGTVSAGGVGAVSSTTFTCTQGISNINNTNANGATYVAYCFAPVAGYSSFGSYTGNGVSGDGVFVYTGMRPRFLLIKRTDTADNWVIWDTARETYNPSDDVLLPNSSGAEATGDNFARLDILSNGFKLRNTSFPGLNGSGASYVWAAFAESPFQYARAR
jgi:hypothetical protein